MSQEVLQAVVTIAGALLAGGMGAAWMTRRKTDAEAASILIRGSVDLSTGWQDQADALRAEIDKLHSRMTDLEAALKQTQGERDAARAEVDRLRKIEQDQAYRIGQLEDRIGQLETENADLRERLDRLESAARRAKAGG